jgi:hypothetical protein
MTLIHMSHAEIRDITLISVRYRVGSSVSLSERASIQFLKPLGRHRLIRMS